MPLEDTELVCRQLEELQGFRANAAGERAGDDLVVDMATSGGAGDMTRVGETAHEHEQSTGVNTRCIKSITHPHILRSFKPPEQAGNCQGH